MSDDDPDETEGRKLYRERADALANAQAAYSRRRILMSSTSTPATLAPLNVPVKCFKCAHSPMDHMGEKPLPLGGPACLIYECAKCGSEQWMLPKAVMKWK